MIHRVKRTHVLLFGGMLLILSAVPIRAQETDGQRKGPVRGFVYEGRPNNDDGPIRWVDFPVVRHVFSGSPAEAAGLRPGDVILNVNGRAGTETTAYRAGPLGSTYTLVVQRGFDQVEISFVLVEPTWLASEWTPPPGTYRSAP